MVPCELHLASSVKRTLRDKHLRSDPRRAAHILGRMFFSDSAPAMMDTKEGVQDAIANVIDECTQLDEVALRRYIQQQESPITKIVEYKYGIGGEIPLRPGKKQENLCQTLPTFIL